MNDLYMPIIRYKDFLKILDGLSGKDTFYFTEFFSFKLIKLLENCEYVKYCEDYFLGLDSFVHKRINDADQVMADMIRPLTSYQEKYMSCAITWYLWQKDETRFTSNFYKFFDCVGNQPNSNVKYLSINEWYMLNIMLDAVNRERKFLEKNDGYINFYNALGYENYKELVTQPIHISNFKIELCTKENFIDKQSVRYINENNDYVDYWQGASHVVIGEVSPAKQGNTYIVVNGSENNKPVYYINTEAKKIIPLSDSFEKFLAFYKVLYMYQYPFNSGNADDITKRALIYDIHYYCGEYASNWINLISEAFGLSNSMIKQIKGVTEIKIKDLNVVKLSKKIKSELRDPKDNPNTIAKFIINHLDSKLYLNLIEYYEGKPITPIRLWDGRILAEKYYSKNGNKLDYISFLDIIGKNWK